MYDDGWPDSSEMVRECGEAPLYPLNAAVVRT